MIALMTVLLCACGSVGGKSLDLSEYRGGAKLESLLDENTYKKNGSKMVKALENMIDASPNDFHMLSRDPKLFDKAVAFEEVFEQSDCEYYYVGKIKDKKPDGYGVLTSGYKEDDLFVYYIGEFKNGAIKDCYGMVFEYGFGYAEIVYEGDLSHLEYSELYPVAADGKQELLYDIDELYNYYGYEEQLSTEELTANKYDAVRCMPYYIGEIKKGKPDGKGIYYDMNGIVEYEGELKNGKMHGKGKIYRDGEVIKEGTFKNGELKDGKVYREN